MASLKRKILSLSEKYEAITELESGTERLKVAEVLTSPMITIRKTAVKNPDLLKNLHGRRYLQLLNCLSKVFTVSLKLVSAIFYQIFIFSPNGSPLKTMKNVFYII